MKPTIAINLSVTVIDNDNKKIRTDHNPGHLKSKDIHLIDLTQDRVKDLSGADSASQQTPSMRPLADLRLNIPKTVSYDIPILPRMVQSCTPIAIDLGLAADVDMVRFECPASASPVNLQEHSDMIGASAGLSDEIIDLYDSNDDNDTDTPATTSDCSTSEPDEPLLESKATIEQSCQPIIDLAMSADVNLARFECPALTSAVGYPSPMDVSAELSDDLIDMDDFDDADSQATISDYDSSDSEDAIPDLQANDNLLIDAPDAESTIKDDKLVIIEETFALKLKEYLKAQEKTSSDPERASTPRLQLRDYQIDFILKPFLKYIQSGGQHCPFISATGTGKTVIMSALISALRSFPILILVPTQVLQLQTASTLHKFVGEELNIATSTQAFDINRDHILVVTYHAFHGYTPADYKKLQFDRFTLLVADEAHNALGPKRGLVIQKAMRQGTQVLGMTATAELSRSTGEYASLVDLMGVGTPIPPFGIRQAVKHKANCPVITRVVSLNTNIKFKKMGNDLSLGDVEHKINKPEFRRAYVNLYLNEVDAETKLSLRGEQGIIFCSGITHAVETANEFNHIKLEQLDPTGSLRQRYVERVRAQAIAISTAGDSAYTLSASQSEEIDALAVQAYAEFQVAQAVYAVNKQHKMNSKRRNAILKKFKLGGILILTGADILAEGFDHPGISFVFNARPSLSERIKIQSSGRALRLNDEQPGKVARIYDFNYGADIGKLFANLISEDPSQHTFSLGLADDFKVDESPNLTIEIGDATDYVVHAKAEKLALKPLARPLPAASSRSSLKRPRAMTHPPEVAIKLDAFRQALDRLKAAMGLFNHVPEARVARRTPDERDRVRDSKIASTTVAAIVVAPPMTGEHFELTQLAKELLQSLAELMSQGGEAPVKQTESRVGREAHTPPQNWLQRILLGLDRLAALTNAQIFAFRTADSAGGNLSDHLDLLTQNISQISDEIKNRRAQQSVSVLSTSALAHIEDQILERHGSQPELISMAQSDDAVYNRSLTLCAIHSSERFKLHGKDITVADAEAVEKLSKHLSIHYPNGRMRKFMYELIEQDTYRPIGYERLIEYQRLLESCFGRNIKIEPQVATTLILAAFIKKLSYSEAIDRLTLDLLPISLAKQKFLSVNAFHMMYDMAPYVSDNDLSDLARCHLNVFKGTEDDFLLLDAILSHRHIAFINRSIYAGPLSLELGNRPKHNDFTERLLTPLLNCYERALKGAKRQELSHTSHCLAAKQILILIPECHGGNLALSFYEADMPEMAKRFIMMHEARDEDALDPILHHFFSYQTGHQPKESEASNLEILYKHVTESKVKRKDLFGKYILDYICDRVDPCIQSLQYLLGRYPWSPFPEKISGRAPFQLWLERVKAANYVRPPILHKFINAYFYSRHFGDSIEARQIRNKNYLALLSCADAELNAVRDVGLRGSLLTAFKRFQDYLYTERARLEIETVSASPQVIREAPGPGSSVQELVKLLRQPAQTGLAADLNTSRNFLINAPGRASTSLGAPEASNAFPTRAARSLAQYRQAMPAYPGFAP